MSGSRWVITPSWLSWSLRSFLYRSSVYSCHLLLISSACVRSVHTISLLYCAHLCMKFSLGISNFLEEICSILSHSIIFYFFALITEGGFLISPCCSLELCIQLDIPFLSSFALASLLFTVICKATSDNYFEFLHFFFLRMILITASYTLLWTSIHSSSGTLSIRFNPLKLFVAYTL